METELSPVKKYTLDMTKFAQVKRNIYISYSIFSVAAIALALYVNRTNFGPSSWLSWGIVIALLAIFTLQGMARRILMQRKRWEAYRLELGEDYILTDDLQWGQRQARRHEVIAIKETRSGLQVVTRTRGTVITVPRSLSEADFAQIKAILRKWSPETKKDGLENQSQGG